jgi:hypothetical protein
MQRRNLLKLGVGGTLIIVSVGGSLAWLRPGIDHGKLASGAREVMLAVARGVLDGLLPDDPSAKGDALARQLAALDGLVAALPAAVQGELSQLLALLASAPGRLLMCGLQEPWPTASGAQVQDALRDMASSSLAPRQQAYHALRELSQAAYFAAPQAWAAIGYPGPVRL